ncbi:MAG: hypothetical protein ACFFDN_50385 [Candidatus Hodarchaeota archaeon]
MRTAFILGAGFSKAFSEKYPIMRDFLEPLFKPSKSEKNGFANKYSFLRKILLQYSFIENESPDIEMVLNFFEYLYDGFGIRENLFEREEVSIDAQKTLLYLKQFIRERCWILPKGVEDENFKIYKKWLECLQADDSILTFNYDLLIEQLITFTWTTTGEEKRSTISFISKRLAYLYSILGSENIIKFNDNFSKDDFHNIEYLNQISANTMHCYLKMHGSVNWWCCSNKECPQHYKILCNGLEYDPQTEKFKFEFPDYRNSCNFCGAPMEIVLITPNSNKTFDRFPRLQVMWQKAGDAIRNSERIVILGYSFSPADLMTRFLLMVNIPKDGEEKKWTIVDREESEAQKVREKLKKILQYREDVQQAETLGNIVEWLGNNYIISD